MNKTILLIALLFAPLSGCLGIPAGAINHGDSVQAVVTVTDLDSGELLVNGRTVEFQVGSGNSGLGFEFERQLIAQTDDFNGVLEIRNDPSTQWSGVVETEARFESDLIQQVPRDQFEPTFGTPTVGMEFHPNGVFFPYEVTSVTDSAVFYKPVPAENQRDPIPVVGAILVSYVEGDQLVQVLEPNVGAVFRILPPSPFNPTTPLGLEPGTYRTLGGDGDVIRYEQSKATNPDIVGHDLRITVRVVNVRASGAPMDVEPVNGNVGIRQSLYINGAPSAIKDYGPLSGESAAHDDDDDHGHQH